MRAAPLHCVAGLLVASAISLAHEPSLAPLGAKPPAWRARRTKRHTSLTGLWTGAYRYPSSQRGVDAVPFNARLEEAGERFNGEIDEPNTYAHPSAPRLFAHVVGARTGLDVRFTKQMDGTGGAAHAIYYEGAADSDLARIDGVWRLGGATGTFFMERAGAEVEAAEARAESATG